MRACMPVRPPSAAAALFWLSGWFCCCGCGGAAADRVEPDLARETLRNVLESWKQGERADAWREETPEVVVQDPDWTAGKKLKGFELLGDGEPRDANLHCQVKLILDDGPSGTREKTVTYVVGTDPVLTVFRDLMR